MSYEEAGAAIGRLVNKRQATYGDSFGKWGAILRIMYPDGIRVEQYDKLIAMMRIIDNLFLISADLDIQGENPFNDIASYCLLGAARISIKKPLPKIKEIYHYSWNEVAIHDHPESPGRTGE